MFAFFGVLFEQFTKEPIAVEQKIPRQSVMLRVFVFDRREAVFGTFVNPRIGVREQDGRMRGHDELRSTLGRESVQISKEFKLSGW